MPDGAKRCVCRGMLSAEVVDTADDGHGRTCSRVPTSPMADDFTTDSIFLGVECEGAMSSSLNVV